MEEDEIEVSSRPKEHYKHARDRTEDELAVDELATAIEKNFGHDRSEARRMSQVFTKGIAPLNKDMLSAVLVYRTDYASLDPRSIHRVLERLPPTRQSADIRYTDFVRYWYIVESLGLMR
jgi:hypothetical protein